MKAKTTKTKAQTKASRIRTLREKGYKAAEIAAIIGCDVQHVYVQNYYDKKQQEKKSTKQKAALERHQKDLEAANEFLRLQRSENHQPNAIVYLPQPEPKLSWSERFRILFTGVV